MELADINSLIDLQRYLIFNEISHKIILVIGVIVVFSYIAHELTKKYRIPSVVGYILVGILFSTGLFKELHIFKDDFIAWYSFLINSFNFVSILAVSFISFTIGTYLSIRTLIRLELEFALIVFLESIMAFVLVAGGMLLIGQPLYLALLLGAVATATAPAATVLVLQEYSVSGELTATLMIVLALDEALAVIIFGFIEPLSLISVSPGVELTYLKVILIPLGKIIGAIGLGLVIGYFSQKQMIKYHNKIQKVLLILATVFGVSALATFLGFSHLVANLAVGFAYRNFAKKRLEIAHHIDTITIPLYAAYFVLAGTKIQISNITSEGFLIIAFLYTLLRIVGKIGGASLGARLSKAPIKVQKYIGFGLLPQIGVAIDMAYIIQHDFIHVTQEAYEVSLMIFNIILFTSIITEILGPLATEYALGKAGELSGNNKS